MEEKRLTRMLSDVFDEAMPIMRHARKGFIADNRNLLKESIDKFSALVKSRSDVAEEIVKKSEKTESERKYLNIIVPLQASATAIENVMHKMLIKAEARVPFTEKAIKEIDSLLIIIYDQLTDVKDYVITENAHLKENIRKNMEEMRKQTDEYEVIHHTRFVTGVCVPKASYLYIDITDSLKRASKALVRFSEEIQ